jgi:quercetin dioxygenase-like cupin family protein
MAPIGEQTGYVRKPSEGPAFWFPGERLTMQATGEQTGGALAFLEDVAAPDGGPPLHLHPEADEAFYVLDGELEVTLGERSLSSPAGSFVWVPRGTPHTWLVRGDRPARFLALYTRAGCERVFMEGGEPAPAPTPPPADHPWDMARVGEAAARHGTVVVRGPEPG